MAKVWNLATSTLLATLTGHRRAVTCATFGRNGNGERVLATGSSDLTVRLWKDGTFECIQMLEGLSAWPTNITFVTPQNCPCIAVACHSGVLHVEDVKQGILAAYDGGHSAGSAIWGLCAIKGQDGDEEGLITLGEDSDVVFWRENSQQIAEENLIRKEKEIAQDQTLANCLLAGKRKKALRIALALDRPQVALKLVCDAYRARELDDLLSSVSKKESTVKLLDFVRQWNAKSRLAEVMAAVQACLLMRLAADENGEGMAADARLEGLRAFNRKHYDRVVALTARLAVADALLKVE